VVLLLVNDHFLRIQWPSWWTGKLGDFAWLIFAPFICALAVSWLIPRRNPRQEQIVGLLSFGFIGVWFATAKTIPAIHDLTTNTLDSIVGWHGTLGLDSTDPITLPALLIGWQVWKHASSTPLSLRPLGWVALALGVMTTLATSCAPSDSGVTELCQQNRLLYASVGISPGNFYASPDGGLTWTQTNPTAASACFNSKLVRNPYWMRAAWLLTSGSQTYRLVPGVGIYSYDNNQNEKLEIDLTEVGSDLRHVYYEGYQGATFGPCGSGTVNFIPGPLDALVDAQTGNLVVTMGLDGILVRSRYDGWQWVTVGSYHYANLSHLPPYQFIGPQLGTALVLFFLLPPTLAFPLKKLSRPVVLGLVLGWILWLLMSLFSPLVFAGDLATLFSLPFWGGAFTGVLLDLGLIYSARTDEQDVTPLLMVVVFSLAIVVLTLLPFILWTRGTIPNQGTASTFSMILCIAGLVTSWIYLRQRFPRRKRKNDEL
jgi:hypothetical protein